MNFVRRIIPFLFLLGLTAPPVYSGSGDSLKVRWINGQKYLLHKVMPKETWSSVSRKYNVSIAELQKANPGVEVLKISQIINIPAGASVPKNNTPAAAPEPQSNAASPKNNNTSSSAKYHTVQKGETLYRISKENGLTVKELQDLNGLSSTNVSVGTKLKVSKGVSDARPGAGDVIPVETTAVKKEPAQNAVIHNESVRNEPVKSDSQKVPVNTTQHTTVPVSTEPVGGTGTDTDPKSTAAGQKIVENGIATWIADTEMNQNKFYALHRTAPVGTIIKVTNRMNNNSVYVKVIGVLPATGDNENVLIKITQAAAQRIGALDQRFQAELSYAAQ